MNPIDNTLTMLLSLLASQLPTLIVCLAAAVVTVLRWNDLSKGAVWALLGFGGAVILCIAIPVIQTGMQQWLMQSGTGRSAAQVRTTFAVMGFVWSILRAVTYALLAAALFAGRTGASQGQI